MLLINITNIIDNKFAVQYLEWLKQVYIPLIRAKCNFQELQLFKIIDSPNEGVSLCLQLSTPYLDEIDAFKKNVYPILQEKMQHDLQGHLFVFDSLLETIAH